MKKAFLMLICIVGVNYLFSADRSKENGFVEKVRRGKRMITMYGAIHEVPSKASIMLDEKNLQDAELQSIEEQNINDLAINSRPMILKMKPIYSGWWGDNLIIEGKGFSKIYASNVLYFDSNAVTANSDSPTTQDKLYFQIPEGVRSGYKPYGSSMHVGFPNVSSSGIGGEEYLPRPLWIVAPRENIELPGLVSIVAGVKNDYPDYPNTKIYVGRRGIDNITYIESINLYVPKPSGPQKCTPPIDSGTGVEPFLTRVANHVGDYEICYVKKVNENGDEKKDIYCFSESNPGELRQEAHLHDAGFDPGISDWTIKGIASSDFGNVFFVAYYLNSQNTYGRVLRVPRDNDPLISSIDSNFGNISTPRYFPYFRTGIIADTLDGENGDPGVLVASAITTSGDTRIDYIVDDVKLWSKSTPAIITDMETDRRISSPYNPDQPNGPGVYWYAFASNNEYMGIATFAEDVVHDVRGFVDAFDWDADYKANGLRLSLNNISQFELTSMPNKSVNNQFEIVTSEESLNFQSQTGYPTTEQVKPRYAKIKIRGWKDRKYYLRVLDPKDLSGYALSNNNPNPASSAQCKSKGINNDGPYLNACDNQIWSDVDANRDFGLCADIDAEGKCSQEDLSHQPLRELSIQLTVAYPGESALGYKELYLKMPGRIKFHVPPPEPTIYHHSAGDNIMLQLSEVDFQYSDWPANQYCYGSQPWACKMPVDAYSGIYTSWKRRMVEREMMFQHGGLLYEDFRPFPNCAPLLCNEIVIYPSAPPNNWSDFQDGDEIWIFTETLKNPPGGLPHSYLAEYQAKKRTIISHDHNYCVPADRCIRLQLNNDLTNEYRATNHDDDFRPGLSNGHAAGFGVIHRGNDFDCEPNNPPDPPPNPLEDCFYIANYDKVVNETYEGLIPLIDNPFNDAYTFFIDPVTYNGLTIGAVPYFNHRYGFPNRLDEDLQWNRFHQLYFKNRSPMSCDIPEAVGCCPDKENPACVYHPDFPAWVLNNYHNFSHIIDSGDAFAAEPFRWRGMSNDGSDDIYIFKEAMSYEFKKFLSFCDMYHDIIESMHICCKTYI